MGKIVHIVLFKLRRSSAEDAFAQAKQAINALKQVPGAEIMHLGPPQIEGRNKGFDWGLYSVFSSRQALDDYNVSKAHVDVVTNNVKPNIEDIMAYDFELDA